MTTVMIAYACALLLFGLIDLVWISQVAAPMYKRALGDLLVDQVRILPAIAFYLLFPAGLVYFAIDPALRSDSIVTALVSGALFGLFTYATFDLTNYAVMRGWTLAITLADIAYGAAVCALVSTATVWIVRLLVR